ncbi:MAG: LamG domain-containing protein [Candidatus Pacebacteria bacterium]|nr:LamG domain-containing protein [Candidatus Paceibacterota bacterium]
MFKNKKQSGFIALTSVLLFGALILVMGLSMASTSISEQAMTGYEKGGEKAISASNACVDLGVSMVKNSDPSELLEIENYEIHLYDDVYCNLSFSKNPDYSYRVKVTGTASVDTSQRSFSHTEYAYVDNHEFIPGLVGYWPMNEGRGTAVYNEASDDRESYLDFDGVDDYVTMGASSETEVDGSVTISSWVKANTVPNTWTIIAGRAQNSMEQYDLRINESGEFIFLVRDSTGYYEISSGISKTNDWIHFVGVFDSSTKEASIYVDGVFVNSAIISDSTLKKGANYFTIGGRYNGSDWISFFDGLIDDVRIYNRALSETEIQKLYNETENITDGLVGHWDMDETFGDLAVDSSGNNNHGTIYGAKRGGSKGKYVGIEAFTTVGSHTWTVPEGVTEVDVLVVGGGGGGGLNNGGTYHHTAGGGGGAGGLIFDDSYNVVSGSSISINVGDGGAGGYNDTAPQDGENSVFDTLVAVGGGRGASIDNISENSPHSGGSGGGGARHVDHPVEGGAGTLNQGNKGGDYYGPGGSSAGGGGASEPGGSSDGTVAQDGGDGLYFGHTFGDNYGEYGWFAGGGGGAIGGNDATIDRVNPGEGGSGGGGDGGDGYDTSSSEEQKGEDALSNTGGGGGGGGAHSDTTPIGDGGSGGSGIVIIRYTRWVDGRHDKSLDFDGVGNYVDVGNDASLALDSDLSISLWSKFQGTVGIDSSFMISKKNANHDQLEGYQVYYSSHNNGTIDMMASDGYYKRHTVLQDNNWHHYMMTWSGTTLSLYIDGQYINGSYSGTPKAVVAGDDDLWIGKRDQANVDYTNGLIDDVRIYNRALTEDEIKFLYQRGLEYHVNR